MFEVDKVKVRTLSFSYVRVRRASVRDIRRLCLRFAVGILFDRQGSVLARMHCRIEHPYFGEAKTSACDIHSFKN